jgi:hypothetical protein
MNGDPHTYGRAADRTLAPYSPGGAFLGREYRLVTKGHAHGAARQQAGTRAEHDDPTDDRAESGS